MTRNSADISARSSAANGDEQWEMLDMQSEEEAQNLANRKADTRGSNQSSEAAGTSDRALPPYSVAAEHMAPTEPPRAWTAAAPTPPAPDTDPVHLLDLEALRNQESRPDNQQGLSLTQFILLLPALVLTGAGFLVMFLKERGALITSTSFGVAFVPTCITVLAALCFARYWTLGPRAVSAEAKLEEYEFEHRHFDSAVKLARERRSSAKCMAIVEFVVVVAFITLAAKMLMVYIEYRDDAWRNVVQAALNGTMHLNQSGTTEVFNVELWKPVTLAPTNTSA